MNVIRYPRNDQHAPGSWKPLCLPPSESGATRTSATFTCPKCKAMGVLTNHEIDPDGLVTPSVVCVNEPECDFHEMIQLEGWIGRLE